MDDKHIRGPLVATQHNYPIADTGDYEGCWQIKDRDGKVVIQIWGDDEGSEAYARVFAAAPELLKSLEGLCGLAELRPGHLQDYKAAIEEARAAIAKATTAPTSAPATASYPCGSLGEPVESEGGEL